MRDGVITEERNRIKAHEREVRELRQATEILRKGEVFVRHWSEDNGQALFPRRQNPTAIKFMIAFVDNQRVV